MAVTEEKLTKMAEPNIMNNARQVGMLENSRELVRWTITAKAGEISKAFEFGSRFVVAKMISSREKGYSTMEEVRDQLTAEVRRDKKFAMLSEKLGKGGSLEAIAAANATAVMTAENLAFSAPLLQNSGMEAYFVGYLLSSKPGQMTKPVKGLNGAYVGTVVSFADVKAPADLNEEAGNLRASLQSRSQYESMNALREKAEIIDNRSKFY